MKVIRKKVGELPEIIEINNTLKDIQREVEGLIQPVQSVVIRGGLFLVNEEGLINGMEPNCYIEGHRFFGPVLFAGTSGEDFADAPAEAVQRFENQKRLGNLGPDHWCWR